MDSRPAQPKEPWQDQRRRKLAQLADIGLPYHPTSYNPTRKSADVHDEYDQLEGAEVTVAGRVVANNRVGRVAFVRIQDAVGRIQLYIKREQVGEALWQYYRLLDLGDLVGASGYVFKTKTEEVSVDARDLVLLQKAYLPPPEKFHGLSDVETRYRQRYVDLIANEESREIALKRSRMTASIRRFLDSRGFLEVETPILQPVYGGGAARPFVTHADLFDMDVYLRIADELYLKRLIVGGFERVYEIGKDFRNEGFSRKHSQEFTMLELYQAYADYNDMMALMEEMVTCAAGEIGVATEVEADGQTIDLSRPWTRIQFRHAMKEMAGVDVNLDRTGLLEFGRANNVVVAPEMSRGALLDQIFSTKVEPHLVQPTFVVNYPVDFPGSTFARASKIPGEVERFEAFMGGIELANAFTEMNDPFEQAQRLDMLERTEGESDDPEERDADFITALEYGMPPTGGLGVGLDRLAMILTGADHIRETILFPFLKRREEPVA